MRKKRWKHDILDWLIVHLKTGKYPGFKEPGQLECFFQRLFIENNMGKVIKFGPTFDEIKEEYADEIDRRWQVLSQNII